MFKVKCISFIKKGSHVFRILSALFWSFFDLAFFLSALASLVFCRVPSLWLPNCVRQSPSQAVAGSAVVVLRRRQRTMNDHEGPPEDQKDHQQSYSLLLINYDSYLMPTQIKFTIIYKNIALEKLSSIFSSNKKIKLN